jgi:hypothetical protein
MADHRAPWARLREVARQRYPDDDMAAEEAAESDEEAAESATEQRALMASFETQRRDEAAWHLMTTERRAADKDHAGDPWSFCPDLSQRVNPDKYLPTTQRTSPEEEEQIQQAT